MDTSSIHGDVKVVLRRMVEPYFKQGETEVIVTTCCKRLFVGTEVPARCRVCGNAPAVLRLHALEDLDAAEIPINTAP